MTRKKKERCVCSCERDEVSFGMEAGVDIIFQIATDGVFWAAVVKPKESSRMFQKVKHLCEMK